MSAASAIEWTDATWNPVTGCTEVSPGCDHCYARTFAERFRGVPGHPFEQGFDVRLWPERLDMPLRWRRPRRVFVNSMSDLFHADIPDDFIARVFAVMSQCPRHVFQVLTKRHGRLRALLSSPLFVELVGGAIDVMHDDPDDQYTPPEPWPLPNVHLGVSAEDQQRAELRVPALLETPAAVRFVSAEPLLGPVDLRGHIGVPWNRAVQHSREHPTHILGPYDLDDPFNRVGCDGCGFDAYPSPLSWVVVGGESGHGARPMDVAWARDVVTQCRDAGTPVFVKQMGSVWAREHGLRGKGADPATWPEDLRVRQMPGLRARTPGGAR